MMQDKNYIQTAMMLEWIGQAPIVINRAFIDLTGNVVTALWLSYAIEKIKEADTPEANAPTVLISMSAAECEKQTGITRAQQQTCRKTLVSLGLLSEEGSKGKTITYRIHLNKMMQMLEVQVKPMADALQRADQHALATAFQKEDAQRGLDWWNGLDEAMRKHWTTKPGNTGVVADAWSAFKNDQSQVS